MTLGEGSNESRVLVRDISQHVENPIFDVIKENGGTYQNQHAGLIKTVMRKKQASDIFYKIHGDRARAYYTRETSEIRTSLDRIYAKDTNSQL